MTGTRAERVWLDEIRTLIVRNQSAAADAALKHALVEHPSSTELRRVNAGLLQRLGRTSDAETVLRALLQQNAADAPSAFALARMLRDQGRTTAAAATLRSCFAPDITHTDADLAITAIELLDECDRKHDAAMVAEAAIARHPDDTRLHAYAAMLHVQLGEFELARRRYLFALEHDDRAWEWHAPIGLSSAQRYRDESHADFALFRRGLHRKGLSEKARAEVHFALGKALDDAGSYPAAAQHFAEGNAIAHALTSWSRKAWRRAVDARLASSPLPASATPTAGFTPIFIVGMPRSGTTLLANLLSRNEKVCNRGELPWLARLATEPALSGTPNATALQDAATRYAQQARRDDASDARWFIDKQPLNFRYVDLALAMFPDAKIIYCERQPRDTALSLWMQCFLEDVQGYAYDFGDIALVMRDCTRLMERWRTRFADAIHTIHYEDMVRSPDESITLISEWIRLPDATGRQVADTPMTRPQAISTASLWQARQPVHTRSIARWERYTESTPGLLTIPNE